jgi:uncharacterized protein YdeI (YjbR/CyaY-like superfamily)
MAAHSREVDAYIRKAPQFARPILEKIRAAFHAGCPGLEERIKWGAPSFEYEGMLGGMAAFKRHVSFGFWKARLMADPEGLFRGAPRASAMGVRVETLADLPAKKVLVAYVKEARRLNEERIHEPRLARPRRSARVEVLSELVEALDRNPKARKTFDAFPPSCKREYVEWILEAKREETRARRLAKTVEWLAEGKRRNWKYESAR